jgi:hypothetical protein
MSDIIINTTKILTLVGSSATIITTDLIIKTISFTASNIYYLGTMFYANRNVHILGIKELEQIEKDIDLFETIKIYESWIIEMGKLNKDWVETSNTVKICIESVHNVLEELHQLLKNIDKKISDHKLKWFSSWRRIDLTSEIAELKNKKSILDKRFNILQNINLDIL